VRAREPSLTTPTALRWAWPRWPDFAPEVVLGAGLLAFLVLETDAATSSFGSVRAVTIMVVTAAVWLLARVATARLLPWTLARLALFGVAAYVILDAVVLPSFRDTTVVEAFPGPAAPVATSAPPAPTTPAAPFATTAPAAPQPSATTTPAAPQQPAVTSTPATPTTAATPQPTAPPPVATEPVRIGAATFRGIDHRAEGAVNLYRQPDGSFVVGLEDIDIQPGPDYDVYVVPGADREDRDGGTRLDDLRGNKGTQFYAVPAEVALADGPWTVLVWCQTFGVPIANATPA
jgi:hypothetical protein